MRERSAPPLTGRPRDPEVDTRVRDATLALLMERGYSGLRIDDVARASTVAKSTIYRRWPSLMLLVLDVVEAALGPRLVPTSDDIEADLAALLRMSYASLVNNPVGWSLPSIGIDLLQQPELGAEYRRRIIDPIRDQAVSLLRRGIAEGRFAPTAEPEAIFDAVAGSIIYRRMIGEPPAPLETLLQFVRAALRP